MDAPKCKICKHRHPFNASHIFLDDATNIQEPLDIATNRPATNRTLNRRDRAAYNEYQKGYMRRRRGGASRV